MPVYVHVFDRVTVHAGDGKSVRHIGNWIGINKGRNKPVTQLVLVNATV